MPRILPVVIALVALSLSTTGVRADGTGAPITALACRG
jgi:hypothetical protein